MATLRAPDGCPWDREQTIDSLKPFVLEETYEVLEAIDRHDHDGAARGARRLPLRGGVPGAARGRGRHFTIADALKRRRQAGATAPARVRAGRRANRRSTRPTEVRARWEEIKAAGNAGEGGETPTTLLSAASPPALPALLRAYQIGTRAAVGRLRLGAAPPTSWRRSRKRSTRLREVVDERSPPSRERAEEEMGDLLFAIANLSRKLGIEPETALRKANDKFTTRFTAMEAAIAGRRPLHEGPVTGADGRASGSRSRSRRDPESREYGHEGTKTRRGSFMLRSQNASGHPSRPLR